jgi:hypothetical protein
VFLHRRRFCCCCCYRSMYAVNVLLSSFPHQRQGTEWVRTIVLLLLLYPSTIFRY